MLVITAHCAEKQSTDKYGGIKVQLESLAWAMAFLFFLCFNLAAFSILSHSVLHN